MSDTPPTRTQRLVSRMKQRWLVHRRLPLILAVTAIIPALPALTAGWFGEDHIQRIRLLGSAHFADEFGGADEFFRWHTGDAAHNRHMRDLGFLPWWSCERLKERFWRPVTRATHWLDYRLWPRCAPLMHAQSLLWLAALVGVVSVLYRRMMGPTWIAGLAALAYALDDVHAMPVGFLANRNVLLAGLFGVCALLAHGRWRRDGRRAGLVLGPALLGVSLLSAEAGIATCAYLAAYVVFIDRGPWGHRLLSMVPYVLVVVVWRIVWVRLGCGIADIGFYADPWCEPGKYAVSLLRWGPVLMLGQWALPPSGFVVLMGPWGVGVMVAMGWACVAGLTVLLFPILRRDRVARFWALGMVLSLAPICAAFPMDRLLIFVGIGAMGLLAQLLATAFAHGGRAWRVLGVALIVIHLIVAPLVLAFRSAWPMGPDAFFGSQVVAPPEDGEPEEHLVIVNAPSVYHALYMPVVRELNDQPVPRHVRHLAPGLPAVSLKRTDARTLVVRPQHGFTAWTVDRMFADTRCPLAVGDRVALTGVTIEVTALSDAGGPAEAVFRFDAPLEDPSLRWVQWTGKTYRAFTPPAVGESVELRPRGGWAPLVSLVVDHLRTLVFWR